MKVCPQCKTENPSKALHCMKCGALLVEDSRLPEVDKLRSELKKTRQEKERLLLENEKLKSELDKVRQELKTISGQEENESLEIEIEQKPQSKLDTSVEQSSLDDNGSKSTLPISADAAAVNWGDGWRIPSEDDWLELMSECEWIWTSINNVNGYRITGDNGRNIFLPAAGSRYGRKLDSEGTFCHYWTRNNEMRLNYSIDAYYQYVEGGCPDAGLPIRAVVND